MVMVEYYQAVVSVPTPPLPPLLMRDGWPQSSRLNVNPVFPTVLFFFSHASLCVWTRLLKWLCTSAHNRQKQTPSSILSWLLPWRRPRTLLPLGVTWPSPSPGVWLASGGLHWFACTVGLFVCQPVRNWAHPLPTGGTLTSPKGLSLSCCCHSEELIFIKWQAGRGRS